MFNLFTPGQKKVAPPVVKNAAPGSLAVRMGLAKKPKNVNIKGAAGGKSTNFTIKGASGPTKVLVANLAKGTSVDDVKAAFSECGEITKAHFPQAGNVEVTFTTRAGANAAVAKFNNAIADGQVLKAAIVGNATTAPAKKQDASKMQIDRPAKPKKKKQP